MIAICPLHTFACSSSLHGGCCPVGLRCAKFQCLEYEYKTLAVFEPAQDRQQQLGQQPSSDRLAAATRTSTSLRPSEAACVSRLFDTPLPSPTVLNCTRTETSRQTDGALKHVIDLPIDERTWGKPTAWSGKIGEIAINRGIGDHQMAKTAAERLTFGAWQLIAFSMIMFAL